MGFRGSSTGRQPAINIGRTTLFAVLIAILFTNSRPPELVIPAPAFAGVNTSPQKRGAGIQALSAPSSVDWGRSNRCDLFHSGVSIPPLTAILNLAIYSCPRDRGEPRCRYAALYWWVFFVCANRHFWDEKGDACKFFNKNHFFLLILPINTIN